MPRAVNAVSWALHPEPGIVEAVGKVLTGSESHLRRSLIPEKTEVKFLALTQIFCEFLGKGFCAPLAL